MDIIGFTPILRAKWIECEECDGTQNGLGSTPRLHKGTWYARNDLGRPLFWGLGDDGSDDLESPGNDPVIVGGSTGDIQNSNNGVLSASAGDSANSSGVTNLTSVQSTTPGGGVSPGNVSSTSDNSSGGGGGSSGGGGGSSGGSTTSPTDYTPWLIGGAAVLGAGVIGYAYWKKHHKGRR
jgi:hypothetical protein